jgi:hypothetical protein
MPVKTLIKASSVENSLLNGKVCFAISLEIAIALSLDRFTLSLGVK